MLTSVNENIYLSIPIIYLIIRARYSRKIHTFSSVVQSHRCSSKINPLGPSVLVHAYFGETKTLKKYPKTVIGEKIVLFIVHACHVRSLSLVLDCGRLIMNDDIFAGSIFLARRRCAKLNWKRLSLDGGGSVWISSGQ